jgi:uncharacterized protein (TIGR00725 family)
MNKSTQSKIKICVSGAAHTDEYGLTALDVAKQLGEEIANHGGIVTTGTTTGFPLWAAMGARDAGATVIAFSPAASEKEHRDVFKLPTDHFDLTIYTGFGYAGADLLLTRASDAVIFGCGRLGTVHEFVVAFHEDKPIGVLEGDWDTDELLKEILKKSKRKHDQVIFDTDPRRLVDRLVKIIKDNT